MSNFQETPRHVQYISVANLPTHSVTIYPKSAIVLREIKDIVIEPGYNEINITGISAYVDENSIKIDGRGTGSAVITDMTVSSVDYNDYPQSESDDEETLYPQDLADAREAVETLNKSLAENIQLLNMRLYGKATLQKGLDRCTTENSVSIEFLEKATALLEIYEKEMTRLNADISNLRKRNDTLTNALKKANSTKKRLQAKFESSREFLQKANKITEKKNLYTPQKCRQVRVIVETDTLPANTKSVVAVAPTGRPTNAEDEERPSRPSLRLSYAVTQQGRVSWVPRYDIRLDTTSSTGILTYRAKYINSTGESWSGARVTLSTSQTTFTGIGDKVPVLEPWHGTVVDAAAMKTLHRKKISSTQVTDRPYPTSRTASSLSPVAPGITEDTEFDGNTVDLASETQRSPIKEVYKQFRVQTDGSTQESARRPSALRGLSNEEETIQDGDNSEHDIDVLSPLRIATSTTSNYGTTTTYELPSTRTILSSTIPRNHTLTELELTNIAFTRTTVPKHRAAVFLAAELLNNSTTTLLRGVAGVTLDGSFCGNTMVSSCFPGDKLSVPLGIDEAIQVVYKTPVHKSSVQVQGLFGGTPERVTRQNRVIVVQNCGQTKVAVTVKDQVPVSDDEKLKVQVKTWFGVENGGEMPRDGVFVEELEMKPFERRELELEWVTRVPEGMGIVLR